VKKTLFIVLGVVVVVVLIALNIRSGGGRKETVDVAEVERRDVEQKVTASGGIQPRRRVNVSASAMGKVTKVGVVEGQRVEVGDFLVQIDPAPYQSAVDQTSAIARAAEAKLELEKASLAKTVVDYERAIEMHNGGYLSEDQLRDAKVSVDISKAKVKSARETLAQYRASMNKARHDLSQVRIMAEMAGVITALNVEEGESAIMGTLNNPGTVLLTIADLSEMEAEVRVDETEVVLVVPGQLARVRLDAFPDTSFAGRVSEVGNSAVRSQIGLGQQSVDFKVVVTITDEIPGIRPGLSASVDIVVAEASDVLTVPIQCLTVRDESTLGTSRRSARDDDAEKDSADTGGAELGGRRGMEGVLIADDGAATFRRVDVGIAGERYFEIKSGVSEGEKVVSGPFRALNDLRDGDPIKVRKDKGKRRK